MQVVGVGVVAGVLRMQMQVSSPPFLRIGARVGELRLSPLRR